MLNLLKWTTASILGILACLLVSFACLAGFDARSANLAAHSTSELILAIALGGWVIAGFVTAAKVGRRICEELFSWIF